MQQVLEKGAVQEWLGLVRNLLLCEQEDLFKDRWSQEVDFLFSQTVFSFLKQSLSPHTLRGCFSPEGGGVVRRGKALELGPLSSLYLLIIRLSLESRSCKSLYRPQRERR